MALQDLFTLLSMIFSFHGFGLFEILGRLHHGLTLDKYQAGELLSINTVAAGTVSRKKRLTGPIAGV